ncbi:hypothetical protein ACFE04_025307 [Oxalis oulophora]
MEDMNYEFLHFPEDFAIRKFCPARIEEEQGDWDEIFKDIEMLSTSDSSTIDTPHLTSSSELDEFADSFFNLEYKTTSNDNNQISVMETEMFDQFQDETDMFFINGFEDDVVPSVEDISSHGVVDRGLHLVHLLLACAEAVGCHDTRLAESMLSQVWGSADPFGDSLQRISYFFAAGLKSRLSLLMQNGNSIGTFPKGCAGYILPVSMEQKIEAFRLLHQTTPYFAFGYMTANEAIVKAAKGKESLHIIDFGMEHTLEFQYMSLLKILASRPEGAPKKIRITGFINDQNPSELEFRMKLLLQDADSLGIQFECQLVLEPVTPALLTRESLRLRNEESLFFNSITHLHKYVKESRGSLKAILQAIKKLGPTLITVIEQDANHNGPFFLGRFLESLHYYSAIFDSLDASLPRNSPQRMKIERCHYAEEIQNIVAFEGSDRIERHERADQWRRQLGRAGFQVVPMKCVSQVRMMLSVYGCGGYTLSSEKGCILLGWRGRPIMLASAWQVNNVSS